ncbi:MAG: hypothetical protein JO051_00830 [Acidobacteriaceae bacterium]|nr:hypothetical protein [Acidobacteriaceae bacterium]
MAYTPADDSTAATVGALSTIVSGLFKVLMDRNIISREEALGILREAQDALRVSSSIDSDKVLGQIYERILKGR